MLGSTAAFLVRAGLLVVWRLLDVRGLRPVLARGWHGQLGRSVWVRPARRADTYALVTNIGRSAVDRECPPMIAASGPCVARPGVARSLVNIHDTGIAASIVVGMEFEQPLGRELIRRMSRDSAAYPRIWVCSSNLSWEFVQEFVKEKDTPLLFRDLDSKYVLAFLYDSGYVQMQPLHITEEKLAVEYARDYLTTHVRRYKAEDVQLL